MRRALRTALPLVACVLAIPFLLALGTGTRPDDRVGPIGAEPSVPSPASTHPDSRAGVRGAGPVAETSTGTDWARVTTIAAAIALGVLVVAGVAYVVTIRGGHRPHRPAHTH